MSTSLEILNSNIVKLYEKTRSSSVGQKTAEGGEIFNAKYDNTAGGRCFRITALSELTENYNITSSEIILNDELNDKIFIGGDDSTSLAVGSLEGTNPWKIFDITLNSGVYHIHELYPEYYTMGFYIALDDETYDQFRFIDSSEYMIKITKDNTTLHLYYGDSSSFGDSSEGCMPTGSYRSMLIEVTGGLYTLDSVEGIEYGDIVSLKIGANYDFFSTVRRVDTELSTVLCKDFTAGTTTDLSDAVMWFPYKPQIGTQVNGEAEHAEGYETTALNWASHSEGFYTLAEGKYSHAQNYNTIAGYACHAEGQNTRALGEWSHAQNMNTTALGRYSTSLGNSIVGIDSYLDAVTTSLTVEDIENAWKAANPKFTVAFGTAALAGGVNTLALDRASTALGEQTISKGQRSLSLGYITISEGDNSLTSGFDNKTYGDNSTTLGSKNISYGTNNFITGSSNSIITTDYTGEWPLSNKNFANITLMGNSNYISNGSPGYPWGNDIYAENCYIEGSENGLSLFAGSTIQDVHVEGCGNRSESASISSTHIEGSGNYISTSSHVGTTHIEGKSNQINTRVNTVHVEGYNNTVGDDRLVEYAHVEGNSNKVYCNNVHVEGLGNIAMKASNAGHVGGWQNTINGDTAFAHGHGLKATGLCSFVIGRYNIENNATKPNGHRFIIGNGTSDTDRSNAFVVTANGKALLPSIVNNDIGTDVNAVATKGYVDSKIMYGNKLPTEIPPAGTIFILY